MDKLKLSRNLWILAGICFLIATIFSFIGDKVFGLVALQGVTSILCLINAYLSNKKSNKNDNEN